MSVLHHPQKKGKQRGMQVISVGFSGLGFLNTWIKNILKYASITSVSILGEKAFIK